MKIIKSAPYIKRILITIIIKAPQTEEDYIVQMKREQTPCHFSIQKNISHTKMLTRLKVLL
jgi:hypothetical protein